MLQDEPLHAIPTILALAPIDIRIRRSTYDLRFGTIPYDRTNAMLLKDELIIPIIPVTIESAPIEIIKQRSTYVLCFGTIHDARIMKMQQDNPVPDIPANESTPHEIII